MRKHMGMFDVALLDRLDAAAGELGQTRVMFVVRACERALESVPGAAVVEPGVPEPSAADLHRLAAAGPEPASVPYAPATVLPPVRRDVGPKPYTPPITKGGKR